MEVWEQWLEIRAALLSCAQRERRELGATRGGDVRSPRRVDEWRRTIASRRGGWTESRAVSDGRQPEG